MNRLHSPPPRLEHASNGYISCSGVLCSCHGTVCPICTDLICYSNACLCYPSINHRNALFSVTPGRLPASDQLQLVSIYIIHRYKFWLPCVCHDNIETRAFPTCRIFTLAILIKNHDPGFIVAQDISCHSLASIPCAAPHDIHIRARLSWTILCLCYP